MTNKIKIYNKKFDYSYTSGAYATIELIKVRPEIVKAVYVHTTYTDNDVLMSLCKTNNIPCIYSDKTFNNLNQKENSYVLGMFRKYTSMLDSDQPHIVLVNPSDMGNLGTIIRTITGFGINNLGLIKPAADIWNPKTVRASMGTLFRIRHECFNSFNAYNTQYPYHRLFPFMLEGTISLDDCPPCRRFSLVFGNEAIGLNECFTHIGQTVKIPMCSDVDSLNLAVAVAIGAYAFARKNRLV